MIGTSVLHSWICLLLVSIVVFVEQDVRTQRNKFDSVVVGIRPVVDCIEPETAPHPDSRPPRPDIIIERCKTAWESFKSFNHDAIVTTTSHALEQRSEEKEKETG